MTNLLKSKVVIGFALFLVSLVFINTNDVNNTEVAETKEYYEVYTI